jgi:hypothetical protein
MSWGALGLLYLGLSRDAGTNGDAPGSLALDLGPDPHLPAASVLSASQCIGVGPDPILRN